MKKNVFVLVVAICAMQVFASEPGTIVGKVPAEVDEASVVSFSEEGDRFYYVYGKEGEYFINADGKKIGPFEKSPSVIHRGKCFSYIYRDDGKDVLVMNGKEVGRYAGIYHFMLIGDKGKYVLYEFNDDDEWFVVTEKKTYGPFEKMPSFVQWKKDGSICFCVREGDYDYVYMNGKKRGPYRSVQSGSSFLETQKFNYSWMELDSEKRHLCVDGKDSEAYGNISLYDSWSGKFYCVVDSVDFEKCRIMFDGKLVRELDSPGFWSDLSIGDLCGDFLGLYFFRKYVAGNAGVREIALLLKDGEVKAEMKSFVEDDDKDSCFLIPGEEWISCPSGKFGPYVSVADMCFDMHGHAVWCALVDFEFYGLFVDGKLIYRSDDLICFPDFEMLGDRFIFTSSYDFQQLNVNGEEVEFDSEIGAFNPRLVPETDGYVYFSSDGDYLGDFFRVGEKSCKAYVDVEWVYYIDGNQIRKIKL